MQERSDNVYDSGPYVQQRNAEVCESLQNMKERSVCVCVWGVSNSV